jgi:hypothetical protein
MASFFTALVCCEKLYWFAPLLATARSFSVVFPTGSPTKVKSEFFAFDFFVLCPVVSSRTRWFARGLYARRLAESSPLGVSANSRQGHLHTAL